MEEDQKNSQDASERFTKELVIKNEQNIFIGKSIINILAYALITWWLNSIRVHSSISFVWILIGLQFLLYCLIFARCYTFANMRWLKAFGVIVLVGAVLGRINDWEFVAIPLSVIVTLLFSSKTSKHN